MGYRDDRIVLKERVEQLEQQAAQSVSRLDAAELRAALKDVQSRLDDERSAVADLLDRLDVKLGRVRRKPRRRWFVAVAVLLLVAGASAGLYLFLVPSYHWERGVHVQSHFEGAANAVRHVPPRREVDVELYRLMSELDGCLSEGDSADVTVEALFEGRNGALREVSVRNNSEHSGSAVNFGCIEQTFEAVGVPPFRAGSFMYQLTLRWTDGHLQVPQIWQRYGVL